MVLADHGAKVIRVAKLGMAERYPLRPLGPVVDRSRAAELVLDLKQAGDAARLRAIVRRANAVVQGFRPGAMERLGLGPEELLSFNPRLVYGRVTGRGQDGPRAQRPVTTSTTSRSPARFTPTVRRSGRRCRSTPWATMPAAAC